MQSSPIKRVRLSRLVKPILRLGFIAALTLLILEVVLQLAFLRLPTNLTQRMPQYRERAGFRLEAEHGARENPAGQQVDTWVTPLSGDLYKLTCLPTNEAESFQPYRVSYKRDRFGFRNSEPWAEKVKLVIIGDSFTAAETIQEPFWQGVSESMLVLSFPGSGTLEQTILLQTFGLPRNPEAVVLAYFAGNDLEDNQLFADLRNKGMTFSDHMHLNRGPLEYLVSIHLLLYLRDTLADNVSNCHYSQNAITSPLTPVAFYDRMLPILAMDVESITASETYQTTRSSILNTASQLNERGIRFVLMYIPQKAELYWDYLNADAKMTIIKSPAIAARQITVDMIDKSISVQRDLLAALAVAHDFDFLDLTPILRSATETGSSPYFFADTHWNQFGHNIARQALRDFLN